MRALFVSGPIGPGHVQRDLAISRELRKIRLDRQIGWFTFDPAARCLRREGERLHPIASRLAIGSRHFESIAGEHNLHAFFALRTMDEVMVNDFLTFIDLMKEGHYDHVIGDEAWEVDRPVARNRRPLSLRSVVLPKPAGAERRVSLRCRPSFSRSIRRGRRTILGRGGGRRV